MNFQEARQILIDNRPDRPRSTEHRKLQCAMDIAIRSIEVMINDEKRGFGDQSTDI